MADSLGILPINDICGLANIPKIPSVSTTTSWMVRSALFCLALTNPNFHKRCHVIRMANFSLSLSLHLALTIIFIPTDGPRRSPLILEYTGEGSDEVPLDPYKNLTTRVTAVRLTVSQYSKVPHDTTILL